MSGPTGTPSSGGGAADRQRARAGRRSAGARSTRLPSPPRQRRPALAAIALLLIVGGALIAGLLAIRMDSRVSVLAASQDIPPGARIDAQDLREVQVASEDIDMIGAQYADQIIGTFTKGTIYRGMLVSQPMLTDRSPVGDGRVIVSVQLNPELTPKELAKGDLVQVVRASGTSASNTGAESGAKDVTPGLVISVTRPTDDNLGGASSGSASLLVPASAGKEVIDASDSSVAGLALVSRGASTDDIKGD